MEAIAELKERNITETPLLLFDCELPDGRVEHWSTHRVNWEGATYEPRVLRHSVFEIRSAPEEGIDAAAKITLVLANPDSYFSQIERQVGWKGSQLTARFAFFDLRSGEAVSESKVVFRGIAQAPEEITEATFRLTATNSLSLQRVWLPQVRVQRRCPWKFPATAEQRLEAVAGGERGCYSPFFRCGYSAGIPGGVGNLDGEQPFSSCNGTRADCQARGMFAEDAQGNPTRRFGGIEFVPPTTMVRSHGERSWHTSEPLENEARYNDFVPLIYGTAWCAPLIVFAKNDGNLTRMEVLVGMGEIENVLKVIVNDVEIPRGESGRDMTGTGWYNVVSLGNRTGAFNLDFADAAGQPLGDCYGSMAVISVVVPNRISTGKSLPRIRALVQGLKLPRYSAEGEYLGQAFTSNPAWIILDILRRCGWELGQIDLRSFAETASYCDELIEAFDLYGNPVQIPRFQCNLVLRYRRSAADVVRGIRTASRLYLTYNTAGKLELRCENTLREQQPEKPQGSNSREPLNGGWPAYEFGDGTHGFSGILRRENGEPAIRFWSRGTAETPNRYTVEFQDAFNEYQQDSLSLVDFDDVIKAGTEVSATLPALGIPNFNQAARIVKFHLDKSTQGNVYVEFETSVRGFGLKPGDIITVTYLKEGFNREPFRILKTAPGTNYGTARITAQIHRDEWYRDDNVGLVSQIGRRGGRGIRGGIPRPLAGVVVNEEGQAEFGIEERWTEGAEDGGEVRLSVRFIPPGGRNATRASIPLVSLAARVETEGGRLSGNQVLYYAVSGVDAEGNESELSFLVSALIPSGSDTNRVTLVGLRFSPDTVGFNVYRGRSPAYLWRIAENQPISEAFTDSGLPYTPAAPPDENYDHANFYWRFELQPEYRADIVGEDRIGSTLAGMPAGEYEGMRVRITRGRGAGQERTVVANDATTLIVSPRWTVVPDGSSYFVVAEAGWHFAVTGRSSPLEFGVPSRPGAWVHVMGRSANANDEECSEELSPLTRWQIGAQGAPVDAGVPGKPSFALSLKGEGAIELSGIAFERLENTRTISAATLTLHYWNELNGATPYRLTEPSNEEQEELELNSSGPASPDDLIQVGAELMKVVGKSADGRRYRVERGAYGSAREPHNAGAEVYHLSRKVTVVPFVRGFFGSRASGAYSYVIYLPDVRVAGAELFVTNSYGNSETAALSLTNTADLGLRTLSGGQLTIQVEGMLAIETAAAPPLVVHETHSVRDVFAVVREAPVGGPIELRLRQDADTYCTLRIEAGEKLSTVVDGFGLGPLRSGAQLNLDILSVGTEAPGRDLTVTFRL